MPITWGPYLSNNTRSLYELSSAELTAYIAELHEPTYRVRQIWNGLYKNLWDDVDQFTNLPQSLKEKIKVNFHMPALQPVNKLESLDMSTQKTLFHTVDEKAIETVLMRYEQRNTACISSQAGCAMGCVFCATGSQMGYKRNLSSGEMINQVIHVARELAREGRSLDNIVIMGMGEPFHNYENTMAAIDRLNDANGFNFGARRFTISTVGLVPEIKRFTAEKRQVNLSISLHAADNGLRTTILPIAKKYPLVDLLNACAEYTRTTHRRITFEWVLIKGFNDSADQARLLASKVQGMLCHVNLILLNAIDGYSGEAPSLTAAQRFQQVLSEHGVPCSLRHPRGCDIKAGCGQLAVVSE